MSYELRLAGCQSDMEGRRGLLLGECDGHPGMKGCRSQDEAADGGGSGKEAGRPGGGPGAGSGTDGAGRAVKSKKNGDGGEAGAIKDDQCAPTSPLPSCVLSRVVLLVHGPQGGGLLRGETALFRWS